MDFHASKPRALPWESLLLVIAAGSVALGFVAAGFWLASRFRPLGGPLALGISMPEQLEGLSEHHEPKKMFDFSKAKAIQRPNAGTDSYVISTTPVRILRTSPFQGNRYLTIGSDQPVRMSTGRAGLTTTTGVFLPADVPKTYGPFIPSVELWLIRGGAADANVGIITEVRA